MEIREILQVLWKRIWLVVLGTLVMSAAAFVMSKVRTPIYQAKVVIMVNQPQNTLLTDLASLNTGEELALTYSKLLKTRPLLETVISSLNLNLSPEELVKDRIGTSLVNGTQLLELTVKDPDPQRASDIANEIVFTFISTHNAEQQLQSIGELEQDVVAEIANLKGLIERNRATMDRLISSPNQLTGGEGNSLQDTLASQQSSYASLLDTYLAVRQMQNRLLDVTVVEPAVPPRRPIGRSSLFFAAAGGFAGLCFGLALALLLHYLDHSFDTSDDVSQVLSLPTLGAIPWLQSSERRSSLAASADPYSIASEAYRALRTNIRFVGVDKPVKSLLVTSAEPNAGKSTVVANLGIVCAQAGLRVVLADADLRFPSQHRLFGLDNSSGLTDLLLGDIQHVQDCMMDTGTVGLQLVTSGPVPPNPSELLGSKRMEAVLAQLQQSADLVLIDSPPVLAVTDAAVLSPKVDGVMLVVAVKRTSHEAAGKAVAALQGVGATVLGVVLVGSRHRGPGYYYRYYPERGKSSHRSADRLASGTIPAPHKGSPD